jgi:S1-C subfamily serine protease
VRSALEWAQRKESPERVQSSCSSRRASDIVVNGDAGELLVRFVYTGRHICASFDSAGACRLRAMLPRVGACVILVSTLCAAAACSNGGDSGAHGTTDAATTQTTSPVTPPDRPKLVELADTVAQVRSGVLRINVATCDERVSGTGILVSPRHVVTVEHVVDGAAAIALTRSRKPLGKAKIIGLDRDRDLALLLLKNPITGYRFRFAKRTPRLGEEVAALGYPLDLPLSVSRGTVSGLDRTIPIDSIKRRRLVQTDAAVNHGNSGGPLIAVKTGEVIGLVDLGTTELNGIAFAVSGTVAGSLVDAWKAAPQPHPLESCPGGPPDPTNIAPPPTGDPKTVGVPPVYNGHFTSVDRLQRCFATNEYVFCSSGPSDEAVQLTVRSGISDESPYDSADVGGPSMPMGTAFTTPAGTIRCDSSSRGVTCTDTASGASFTIGDYRIVIRGGAGGGQQGFSGYFASVDRLQRCFMDVDFVACTSGPSGKGVSLSAGGSAVYEGITGSSDHGGPALAFGKRVTSSSGAISCDSSSRGVTCSDSATSNRFVIGDRAVITRNNGQETSH